MKYFKVFISLYFNLLFRSPTFNQKDNNPPRSFQDSTRSVNNFNRNNGGSNSQDRISRDYLIDSNDVPRLIGKGGVTIKQIQRDNDVQIKVSNDRQNQWVDLMISGSNDQVNNTFNQIKNMIGSIKEKNESFQSKSFFKSGIFVFIYTCFNHYFYRFQYEYYIFILKNK